MKSIQFLGAAGEVTGSSFLLTLDSGKTLLVDLGMFQGEKDSDAANMAPLKFDAQKLTAVLLTHAHIDHCGRLPLLIKNGYKGPVYMTKATKLIMEVALMDSVHVFEEDSGQALYTEADVATLISQVKTVAYNEAFHVTDQVVTYRDAGHILGSASIEIKDQDGKITVFSGDLGNTPQELILPTYYIQKADRVIVESTYGDRSHDIEDAAARIQSEINTIEEGDSVLLIPAFSIQRTQELLHIISHLKAQSRVRLGTPIFVDSPMAIAVTEIFKQFPELYNEELTKDVHPFEFPGLAFTNTRSQSKFIWNVPGPKVIIAGSGMMSGGRIMHHLKKYLPLKSTRLLIVGYQAEGTTGRLIEEGRKNISMQDESIQIRATISKMSSLSAHADQPKLLNWLKAIKGVSQVFLVHGDTPVREVFKGKIQSELKIGDVQLPDKDQTVELS